MVLFPPEILETFAPHLPSSTINSLRLVNHYFYEVFNADKVWKQYIYYHEKHFLCDGKSHSKVSSIGKVLEEISQCKVGKWRGYFKLQRAHLQNWVSGEVGNFDTLPSSPKDISSMEEMVDNNNEHWLFFSVGEFVNIWNITAAPQPLVPVNVGFYSKIHLLPYGIMLVKECFIGGTYGVIAVYQFEPPMYNLTLMYKFMCPMDKTLHPDEELSLTHFHDYQYILFGDLFIGYDPTVATFHHIDLHIWNLKLGIKVETIDLSQYCEINQTFANFVKMNSPKALDLSKDSHGVHLTLLPGQFPCIVTVLKYNSSLSQVNIFNVKSKRFTHLVDQIPHEVLKCLMHSNKIALEERINKKPSVSQVSIYALQSVPIPSTNGDAKHGELLRRIESPQFNNYLDRTAGNENIMFKNSKVLVKTSSGIHIFKLDTEPLQCIKLEIVPNYSFLGFIEPKLLLMYNTHEIVNCTTVKVLNILSGEQIITWPNANVDGCRFLKYFSSLEYPAKLVLNFKTEQGFRVFNF